MTALHPALDIDLFATSAVQPRHTAETAATGPRALVAQVAAGQFQSSPAPCKGSHNSGEAEPSVTPAYGAGEAFRPPAGYRLVRVETLEMIAAEMVRLKQFERLPSFLRAPDHLNAVERGAA